MIIDFEHVNGFSGLVTDSIHIDTMTLTKLESRIVDKMVRDADFFNLPGHIFRPGVADANYYRLTVEGRGNKHTVEVDMAVVPEKLQPLIDRLNYYIEKSKTPMAVV